MLLPMLLHIYSIKYCTLRIIKKGIYIYYHYQIMPNTVLQTLWEFRFKFIYNTTSFVLDIYFNIIILVL